MTNGSSSKKKKKRDRPANKQQLEQDNSQSKNNRSLNESKNIFFDVINATKKVKNEKIQAAEETRKRKRDNEAKSDDSLLRSVPDKKRNKLVSIHEDMVQVQKIIESSPESAADLLDSEDESGITLTESEMDEDEDEVEDFDGFIADDEELSDEDRSGEDEEESEGAFLFLDFLTIFRWTHNGENEITWKAKTRRKGM